MRGYYPFERFLITDFSDEYCNFAILLKVDKV